MTKLNKSLKSDLPALAELLRSKGKGKDTILAHINPREAALLKRHGGSGDINPDTGLPMFDDEGGFNVDMPAEQAGPPVELATPDIQNSYTGAQSSGGVPVGTETSIGGTQDAIDLSAGQFAGAVPQGQAITGGTVGDATVFAPNRGQYTQADLDRISVGQSPTNAPQQQESPLSKLGGNLGNVSSATLLKALGLGGLGLLGARNARQGNADVQASKQEQQAIAQPYQAQGQEMIGAAQRGELTPQSQQAYQAAMAQSNQAMAGRGGVGQQQQQQQMAALYNQLLQNQYTYGLQVAQIGDNIAIGAIKSGLQQDRALQQTTQNFYTQLAAIASGSVIGGTRQGVA